VVPCSSSEERGDNSPNYVLIQEPASSFTQDQSIEIVNAECTTTGLNQFGHVSSGSITIRGSIKLCILTRRYIEPRAGENITFTHIFRQHNNTIDISFSQHTVSESQLPDTPDILVGTEMVFTHDDGDAVLVSCHSLYPDVWIDEEGPDKIFPPHSPPPRLDVSLVLKRSPVVHGALERIGIMLSDVGSATFRDTREATVRIV
jgi:hypothetical protein